MAAEFNPSIGEIIFLSCELDKRKDHVIVGGGGKAVISCGDGQFAGKGEVGSFVVNLILIDRLVLVLRHAVGKQGNRELGKVHLVPAQQP